MVFVVFVTAYLCDREAWRHHSLVALHRDRELSVGGLEHGHGGLEGLLRLNRRVHVRDAHLHVCIPGPHSVAASVFVRMCASVCLDVSGGAVLSARSGRRDHTAMRGPTLERVA